MATTPDDGAAGCLAALEAHLATDGLPDLAGTPEGVVEGALRALARLRGADAVPLIRRLADEAPGKGTRKAARRALYRLAQAGVAVPGTAPAAPVVRREHERPARAWLSGIDGVGSRAVWIVFEGGVGGGLRLCSLIVNDEAGVMEVAGGPVTRKRLESELAALRAGQKLPWVETDAGRAAGLVAEALALHERAGTRPPAEFARWQPLFAAAPAPAGPAAGGAPDPALVERSAELCELPEFLGWFVDPATVQEEAVARLEMQDSRLIVSDQIKAEREKAIVDGAVDKAFTPITRPRWARRLHEMVLVLDAAGRGAEARLAEAASRALADLGRSAASIPLARALAQRGIEVAGEVTLGRVKLEDVTRAPRPGAPAAP